MAKVNAANANLSGADFSWAFIDNTDFTGVKIAGTRMRGAKLTAVKGIKLKKKEA